MRRWSICLALLAITLGLLAAGCQTPPLGLVDGRLRPPRGGPSGVSSQVPSDDDHRVAPLRFAGDPAAAFARLRAAVDALPRSELVTAADGYLHFEFRSLLLRFIDDVEFLLEAEDGEIHVRSVARLGYYDFGVNRRRVATIRAAFADAD